MKEILLLYNLVSSCNFLKVLIKSKNMKTNLQSRLAEFFNKNLLDESQLKFDQDEAVKDLIVFYAGRSKQSVGVIGDFFFNISESRVTVTDNFLLAQLERRWLLETNFPAKAFPLEPIALEITSGVLYARVQNTHYGIYLTSREFFLVNNFIKFDEIKIQCSAGPVMFIKEGQAVGFIKQPFELEGYIPQPNALEKGQWQFFSEVKSPAKNIPKKNQANLQHKT